MNNLFDAVSLPWYITVLCLLVIILLVVVLASSWTNPKARAFQRELDRMERRKPHARKRRSW